MGLIHVNGSSFLYLLNMNATMVGMCLELKQCDGRLKLEHSPYTQRRLYYSCCLTNSVRIITNSINQPPYTMFVHTSNSRGDIYDLSRSAGRKRRIFRYEAEFKRSRLYRAQLAKRIRYRFNQVQIIPGGYRPMRIAFA